MAHSAPPAAPARRERLFLLDGMALAYRAYFSFISRPLINSRGENTSAIFGFVNTLMKILNEDRPDHIAVVFDTKEPTFRHIMYGPYKATREKMPEEMAGQLEKLKEVVQAFNVPTIELPGYEADDIMGTLARKAERQGIETYLVTGDKDFMQLISPLVMIYKPGKQGEEWEILDARAVLAKFGVEPSRVIDVLGLIGDKSDNVPGVYGVGEKSAIPLVQEYGSIENIIEHLDDIPQKGLQEKIRGNVEQAILSKKLVTIDTNVPIDVDLHHLTAKEKDRPRLLTLFNELEFRNLAKRLSEDGSSEPAVPPAPMTLSSASTEPHAYHLVTTEKELGALAKLLKRSRIVCFDTETTSTDAMRAELLGMSFATKPGEAWYVPIRPRAPVERRAGEGLFGTGEADAEGASSSVVHPSHCEAFPLERVVASLGPLLADPAIMKVGQNIKYDMLVLAAHGMETAGALFDTMVAHYVLRPEGQHGMDAMAVEHLSYRPISYDDLTGTGRDRKDLVEIDIAAIAEYAAEDADVTVRLFQAIRPRLEEVGLLRLCEELEFPLISVLAEMEQTGVALDLPFLAGLSKEMERILERLTGEICADAGETFNINSTKQLSKILFEKLNLGTVRKTKTGFSTDVAVLEALRHKHPIIERLLEYRQIQKLKSTYVDALPALIHPVTGRIHTSFNQTVAATGRLSSSNPNLQNIPIRTEAGRDIRRAFIAGKKGSLILAADYSQIELRIMAHVSGDEGLREAFRNGEDIHATTAAKVFGLPAKEVTKEMRRKAKEVNFGIMYGIGPFGLAARLDISQTEAKEIISTYVARFPKVQQYISDTIAGARRDGYVSTLLGRRRYLPEITSKNFNVRGNAERQAINMPIQGTAADMIKMAMIRIHRRVNAEKLGMKMVLQVHDELVFEIPKTEERKAAALVAEEMRQALPLSVPIEVEVGAGKNWLEAH